MAEHPRIAALRRAADAIDLARELVTLAHLEFQFAGGAPTGLAATGGCLDLAAMHIDGVLASERTMLPLWELGAGPTR